MLLHCLEDSSGTPLVAAQSPGGQHKGTGTSLAVETAEALVGATAGQTSG